MDVERVVVRMLADSTQYNRAIGAMEGRLLAFAAMGGGLGNMLSLPFIVGAGAVTGFATAVIGASVVGLKLASDYQTAAVAFEVMTGSASLAKKMLDDINQLAVETPFKSPELMAGAKQLKAFGFETDQIIPTLRALGEVSSGTGTKMERIILAFGQVRVAGRLMGPELRQMVDAGIPAFEYLGKVMGKPVGAIKGLVEEGKVSFGDVLKAFNAMTQDGGIFFNMMERQSQTAAGRWNAFVETIEIGLRNVGLAFFEGFDVANVLDDWRVSVKEMTSNTNLVSFFADMKRGLEITAAYFKYLAEIVSNVYHVTSDWIVANQDILKVLALVIALTTTLRLAVWAVNLVVTVLIGLMYTLRALLAINAIISAWVGFLWVLGLLSPQLLIVVGLVAGFVTWMRQLEMIDLSGMFNRMIELFNSLGRVIGLTFEGITASIRNQDFRGAADIAFKGIEVAFKYVIASLKEEFTRFWEWIKNAPKAAAVDWTAEKIETFSLGAKVLGARAMAFAGITNEETKQTMMENMIREHRSNMKQLQEMTNEANARRKTDVEALIKSSNFYQDAKKAEAELEAMVNKATNPEVANSESGVGVSLETELYQRMLAIASARVNYHSKKFVEDWEDATTPDWKKWALRNRIEMLDAVEGVFGNGLIGTAWANSLLQTGISNQLSSKMSRDQYYDRQMDKMVFGVGSTTALGARHYPDVPLNPALGTPLMSILGGLGSASTKGYEGMRLPIELSSEVKEMVKDLRREREKEQKQGIGVVGGQLSHFESEVKLLDQAFFGPLGKAAETFMGAFGAAPFVNQGIIDKGEYEFGLLRNYANLDRWVKKASGEDIKVRAMERGSVEAQDTINKAGSKQVSVLEEIRDTFKRAEILQQQQRDFQEKELRALEQVLKERGNGVTIGGTFFNTGS